MSDDSNLSLNEAPRQPPRPRTGEDRYRLIVKLGRVVNANLDMRQVFRAAARGIRPLFRCDRIHLLLVDRARQTCSGFALEYGAATRWVEVPVHPLSAAVQ